MNNILTAKTVFDTDTLSEKQARESKRELRNYKNKLYEHFSRQDDYHELEELLDL